MIWKFFVLKFNLSEFLSKTCMVNHANYCLNNSWICLSERRLLPSLVPHYGLFSMPEKQKPKDDVRLNKWKEAEILTDCQANSSSGNLSQSLNHIMNKPSSFL